MHLVGARVGFTIALLADPLRWQALPRVRPTSLPSVPRVYEVYAGVRGQFDAATGVGRLIDWALRVGYRSSPYRQRGERLPRPLAAVPPRQAVYSKVKDRLGGRLRGAISGGAPLAPEIGEFFHAIDITILEELRMQVHDGVLREPPRPRALRDGRPRAASLRAAGRRGRRDPDRGETIFAEYLKDEEATRQVLDADGWLHSGDIGTIDEDGFLRITDRKKDILITAGGKNVAPQNLENALKSHPRLAGGGGRRPPSYVAALITLDPTVTGSRPRGLEEEIGRIVDAVASSSPLRADQALPRARARRLPCGGRDHAHAGLKRRVVTQHADEIEGSTGVVGKPQIRRDGPRRPGGRLCRQKGRRRGEGWLG